MPKLTVNQIEKALSTIPNWRWSKPRLSDAFACHDGSPCPKHANAKPDAYDLVWNEPLGPFYIGITAEKADSTESQFKADMDWIQNSPKYVNFLLDELKKRSNQ